MTGKERCQCVGNSAYAKCGRCGLWPASEARDRPECDGARCQCGEWSVPGGFHAESCPLRARACPCGEPALANDDPYCRLDDASGKLEAGEFCKRHGTVEPASEPLPDSPAQEGTRLEVRRLLYVEAEGRVYSPDAVDRAECERQGYEVREVVLVEPAPPSPTNTGKERCERCGGRKDYPQLINEPGQPHNQRCPNHAFHRDSDLLEPASANDVEEEPRYTTTVHDRSGNPVGGCDFDALHALKFQEERAATAERERDEERAELERERQANENDQIDLSQARASRDRAIQEREQADAAHDTAQGEVDRLEARLQEVEKVRGEVENSRDGRIPILRLSYIAKRLSEALSQPASLDPQGEK